MTEHRSKGLQAEADLTAVRAHLQAVTDADRPDTAAAPPDLSPEARARRLADRARRRGIGRRSGQGDAA